MADTTAFTATADVLRKVNKVVAELEPTIQLAAFELLVEQAGLSAEQGDDQGAESSGEGSDDELAAKLLQAHGDQKPAENALMVAALWFATYGKAPFRLDDIRASASELGVSIPDRLPKLVNEAKRKGNKLFRNQGHGRYAPTVHGETFFKETYGVRQGKAVPPAAGQRPT